MELQQKIQNLIDQMRENVSKATGKRNDSIDYQLLTDLRKTHRELYRSIEGNRRINQLEKDQLDKQTINSECLKYSKTQLQQQIGQFKALQTNHYNQIRRQLDLEGKNPLDHNKEILHKLETELEVRREKKKKHEEITSEFEHLHSQYEQKKSQYFQMLPELLKQTQSHLIPTLNMFEIPHLALPSQQEFFQQLPQPLHQIYQKLQTKFIQLEIISHPISDSFYKQSQFELKVTIEQGIFDQIALNYLGIKQESFYENIYPFSFSIRYFTTLDKIVFQVDRKNQISSEELFCGLFQGDPGEPIFINAKNDEEININTKYMSFRWAKLLTGFELSPQEFYLQLQKRIYNIQLIKIQLQKLQKNELLTNFPGLNFEQRFQLKYFGNSQINDDTPFWYKFCQGESLIYKQNKDTTLLVEDKTLQSYIQLNYRFEGQAEHLHDCYKMVLAKDDQQIEIGIILPLSYPQQYKFYIQTGQYVIRLYLLKILIFHNMNFSQFVKIQGIAQLKGSNYHIKYYELSNNYQQEDKVYNIFQNINEKCIYFIYPQNYQSFLSQYLFIIQFTIYLIIFLLQRLKLMILGLLSSNCYILQTQNTKIPQLIFLEQLILDNLKLFLKFSDIETNRNLYNILQWNQKIFLLILCLINISIIWNYLACYNFCQHFRILNVFLYQDFQSYFWSVIKLYFFKQ